MNTLLICKVKIETCHCAFMSELEVDSNTVTLIVIPTNIAFHIKFMVSFS